MTEIKAVTDASFASAARTISPVERASAGPSRSLISARVKPSRRARRMNASRHRSSSVYSANPDLPRAGRGSRPRRW